MSPVEEIEKARQSPAESNFPCGGTEVVIVEAAAGKYNSCRNPFSHFTSRSFNCNTKTLRRFSIPAPPSSQLSESECPSTKSIFRKFEREFDRFRHSQILSATSFILLCASCFAWSRSVDLQRHALIFRFNSIKLGQSQEQFFSSKSRNPPFSSPLIPFTNFFFSSFSLAELTIFFVVKCTAPGFAVVVIRILLQSFFLNLSRSSFVVDLIVLVSSASRLC